jgi:ribose 5-phosphate isomerase A
MGRQKTQAELEREKQAAARAALSWVQSGMRVGLGTGSTAGYFIEFLGERLRAGQLRVEAVASSLASEKLARQARIPLLAPAPGLRLDLTVDGADEIGPDLTLIKGHGGAFVREKVLARVSQCFLVIGDSSKRVRRLGKRPLPVEVVPFALPWVADLLKDAGAQPTLRMDGGAAAEPFLTDQQNQILDCRFASLDHPRAVASFLEGMPGVVGHGLFVGYAHAALVAEGAEVVQFSPSQ